jgi:hypothetical protein
MPPRLFKAQHLPGQRWQRKRFLTFSTERVSMQKLFLRTIAAGTVLMVNVTMTAALAETVESAFDINTATGSVEVGKKGQAKHKYTVGHSRAGQRLDVTLAEQGAGGANGTGSKFTYDASKNMVQLSVGTKVVNITIAKDRATIGTTTCSAEDTQCISKAVYDALPQLSPQEVAAALSASANDLLSMAHGDKIQDVMEALALVLANQQSTL